MSAKVFDLTAIVEVSPVTTLSQSDWQKITYDGAAITQSTTVASSKCVISGVGTLSITGNGTIKFTADAGLAANEGGYTFTNSAPSGANWTFTELDLSATTSALALNALATVTKITLGSGMTAFNASEWAGLKTLDASVSPATLTAGDSVTTLVLNATAADTFSTASWTGVTSLTTGSAADTITLANTNWKTVNAGDGNDTVSITGAGAGGGTVSLGAGNDTLTVTADLAANTTLAFGDGTDTLVLNTTAQSNAVELTGYTYGTDTIKGDTAVVGATFNNVTGPNASTGIASIGGLNVTATSDSDIYKFAVTNTSTSKTEDFWTAKAAAVTMDASGLTHGAKLDAAAATSAVITGTTDADTITLSTSKNATLNVGKAAGTDTITNYAVARDTLNFVGGTVKDLKFTSVADTLNYSNTKLTLSGALSAATDQKLKVSFDGGTAETILVNNSAADATLDAVTYTDASVFIGSTANGVDTAVKVAAGASLYSTDTYINVDGIVIANSAAAGAYVGNSDKVSTIAAEANLAKSVEVWGGSVQNDTITLGQNNTVADTVWFGSTDGTDTIMQFDAGFGTAADTVRLWNISSLSNVSVAKSTVMGAGDTDVVLTVGGSVAKIAEKTASDKIQLMLSDGTVKKVAYDQAVDATIASEGADLVIGNKATATSNAAVYGSDQTDAFSVSLWNTDAYQNIASVTATEAQAAATLVGSAKTSSTLSSSAAYGSQIWGGSSDSDTITLAAGAGTDVVWFGASDGKDAVNAGFTAATDVVKFWDASSVKEVFNNYSLTTLENNSLVYTSQKNTDSTLTITATDITAASQNTLNLADGAGDSVKAVVTTGTALTFATDAQIYSGGTSGAKATVTAGAGITGNVTVFLDNGDFADNGNYYFGSNVTTFDGSGSTASFTMIGRNDQGSTLKGGLTSNAMWGGGLYSDTLVGNNSAVDTVWFGTSDGADTFSTVDKGDVVHLYDVASSSIGNVAVTLGTGKETVSLGTSMLTIEDTDNAALTGGLTFTTSDNVSYTYDSTSKALVKKA